MVTCTKGAGQAGQPRYCQLQLLHIFRHLTCAVEALAEGAGQVIEFVQLGMAANDCQSVPPLVQGTFLDQPYNM